MVRIRQEIEHGEVDGEDAHGGATHRERRHDPVDPRERGPAEPEQADGHQRALDAAEVEPPFGAAGGRGAPFAVAQGDLLLVDAQGRRQQRPDAHCGEHSAALLDVEVVVCAEDERDAEEGQVQDGPAEGDP